MRYILWSIVALLLLAVAMIGQVWLSNPATMGRPQWRAGDVVVGRVGHIAMRHAPSAVRPETPFSMSSALRRQAASEAKSLEVVFRQCRKITSVEILKGLAGMPDGGRPCGGTKGSWC